MKTLLLLGSILLGFSGFSQTRARALKLLANHRPINIGDTISQSILERSLRPVDSSITAVDLKGKIIILDWWSPECAPCLAAMPKLDSIQKRFKEKALIFPLISVLHINDSVRNDIKRFWNKNKYTKSTSLPWIIDTVLYKRFPHDGVPFVVWIDSGKVVRAFTSSDRVNVTEVNSFHSGTQVTWENANKIKFDYGIPFKDQELIKNVIIKRTKNSITTTYVPRVRASSGLDSSDTDVRFYVVNASIVQIFRYILGFTRGKGDNPIDTKFDIKRFEVKHDNSIGIYLEDWQKRNLFSYEIYIPKSLTFEERCQYVIDDLNNSFSLRSEIKEELTSVAVLKDIDKRLKKEKLPIYAQINSRDMEVFGSVEDFVVRLRQLLFTVPVFSDVRDKQRIISISNAELGTITLNEITRLNKHLAKSGYRLIAESRLYPVLTIK